MATILRRRLVRLNIPLVFADIRMICIKLCKAGTILWSLKLVMKTNPTTLKTNNRWNISTCNLKYLFINSIIQNTYAVLSPYIYKHGNWPDLIYTICTPFRISFSSRDVYKYQPSRHRKHKSFVPLNKSYTTKLKLLFAFHFVIARSIKWTDNRLQARSFDCLEI